MLNWMQHQSELKCFRSLHEHSIIEEKDEVDVLMASMNERRAIFLVVLKSFSGDREHCIAVTDNLIFNPTFERALPLSKETLDLCCFPSNYVGVAVGFKIVPLISISEHDCDVIMHDEDSEHFANPFGTPSSTQENCLVSAMAAVLHQSGMNDIAQHLFNHCPSAIRQQQKKIFSWMQNEQEFRMFRQLYQPTKIVKKGIAVGLIPGYQSSNGSFLWLTLQDSGTNDVTSIGVLGNRVFHYKEGTSMALSKETLDRCCGSLAFHQYSGGYLYTRRCVNPGKKDKKNLKPRFD